MAPSTTPEIKTLSYDARILFNIRVWPWYGITLRFRQDCNGVVGWIDANSSGYIYLVNYSEFAADRAALMNDVEFQKQHPNSRGIQYDVEVHPGWIFTSHTYVKGSCRGGGYASYALK